MITLHYQNVTAARIGRKDGLSDAEIDRAVTRAGPLYRRFQDDATAGDFGFATLLDTDPVDTPVVRFAEARRGAFQSFVQIGIGGSALGAVAIHAALSHRFHNETAARPRFYALDNVDPEETRALFDILDPRTTMFHVVTKSGDTTETMAGFLSALRRLRDALGDGWRNNVVVTTDPGKGFLRKFARDEGLVAFDIPPAVGGRFSVLSPVGLLPAAMIGADVPEIIYGAQQAADDCRRAEPRQNVAFVFALLSHLLDLKRGKRIHVMMPYARALRDTADWFRQLWGESLGKTSAVGPTPVVALGTTDQHSQMQLYTQGPNDKFIVFLECEKFRQDEVIPAVLPKDAAPSFLQGRSFGEVIGAMKRGTESALTSARRPNATLLFEEISARSLGWIFYLLEAATVYAGRLYGVNPFDQPGVEAGKKAAFAFLGRPGYEAPPAVPPDPRYIAGALERPPAVPPPRPKKRAPRRVKRG